MTIQSSSVLKGLRALSRGDETKLGFLSNTTCICRADDRNATYDYSKYAGEIHGIISYLAEEGYLCDHGGGYTFSLTHKGLHPYQIRWNVLKGFLFKSVAVPVSVSLITTILTLLVQELL